MVDTDALLAAYDAQMQRLIHCRRSPWAEPAHPEASDHALGFHNVNAW